MKNPWILVVLWMMVIFWFSSRNGEESGLQSGIILSLLQWVGLSEKWLGSEAFVWLIRKLAHFTEFFILGVFIFRTRLSLWTAFLIIFLYAVSDELHQYFVPGRQAAIVDVCIDSLAGILSLGLMRSIFRRKD